MGHALQYVGIATVLLAATIGSLTPWCISRKHAAVNPTSQTLPKPLIFGNMFAGGVFIGVSFMHMLGDAVEDMRETTERYDFPFGLCFFGLGFMLTLCIDQAGHAMADGLIKRSRAARKAIVGHSAESPLLVDVEPLPLADDDGPDSISASDDSDVENPEPSNSRGSHVAPVLAPDRSLPLSFSVSSPDLKTAATHIAVPAASKHTKSSLVTCVLVTVMFSFHSVFAGLALGVDHTSSAVATLIAILAHKGLAAFALGSNLINARMTTKAYWAIMVTFSFMTPIGIVIGLGLHKLQTPFALACCFAIAGGTFLYVGLCEIILPMLKTRGLPACHRTFMLILMFLGFGAMALVQVYGA